MISGFRRAAKEMCALFGFLAAYKWQFLTDVSGQPIGFIFKGQVVPGMLGPCR
jgi:hypothetical protein